MSGEIVQEAVRFAGPAGVLAGELAYPSAGQPGFAALLVGPHPYMGGTMANNVVSSLAMRLAEAGGVALRFDYSGTGGSEGGAIDVAASMNAFWRTGHAPEDPRRVLDAGAAADYVRSLDAGPIVLIGYSFGCFAGVAGWRGAANLRAAGTNVSPRHAAADPAAIILISPTVTRHDFAALDAMSAERLVIHSENDFATPPQAVATWFENVGLPKRRRCVDDGDHFFRGQEAQLGDWVAAFVGACIDISISVTRDEHGFAFAAPVSREREPVAPPEPLAPSEPVAPGEPVAPRASKAGRSSSPGPRSARHVATKPTTPPPGKPGLVKRRAHA